MARRLGIALFNAALLISWPLDASDGIEKEVDVSWDCVIDTPPSELTLRMRSHSGGQLLAAAGSIELELANTVAKAGQARIVATAFSEQGLESIDPLATVELEPHERRVVKIPMAELRLPLKTLSFSGRLWFTASISFEDGSRGFLHDPTELYFHPIPGAWMVYDQDTRDKVFDRGALSPRAKSLTAKAASPESGFGAAIVAKVAEHTHWRPELDGPPDPSAQPDEEPVVKKAPIYPLVFCIDQLTSFGDAGIGEDFWQSDSLQARKARGAFLSVVKAGVVKWEGYLGDGIGTYDPGLACTPPLSGGMDPVTYQLVLWSKAQVQGNDVLVTDEAIGLIRSSTIWVGASTGTYNLTMAPVPDEFNVCAVGAYALYRHAGGMTGQIYNWSIGRAVGSRYDRATDTLQIKSTHHHMKFLLIHEMGHALGDYATGNQDHKLVGINCEDFSSGSCPAAAGDHSMCSKEYAKCALGEGFAHFYSADVFNDHDEADCFFHYYKNEFGSDDSPIVNCEVANGDFDQLYMESNCALAWKGYGTELDWLRAFWDLHTDSTSAPSFTEIVQWLDSSPVWGNLDAYDLIDLEAERLGGQLDLHWDVAKTRNGIDWPVGDYLLFADWFESGDTSRWQ